MPKWLPFFQGGKEMKEIPEYTTPQGYRCPECRKLCKITPLRNEFDYAGTHITHGRGGTHYPDNWGEPVTDCCRAFIQERSTFDSMAE